MAVKKAGNSSKPSPIQSLSGTSTLGALAENKEVRELKSGTTKATNTLPKHRLKKTTTALIRNRTKRTTGIKIIAAEITSELT